MSNKIIAIFNMEAVKELIETCAPTDVVILCPHWSINGPKYDDCEFETWDFDELEEILGCSIYVTDYDDLIADPHGIYNE